MSLTRIEYGSLASSSVLNNNFDYLENKIEEISGHMDDNIAGFSSQVETFRASVDGLLSYRSSFIATGMIVPSLISGIPDGFLLCDGSELAVADFEDLYDVIGTTFGSSDSTKFNLPDLRDKTLWGVGGNTLGTFLDAGLPNITGSFYYAGGKEHNLSSASGAFAKSSHRGVWNQGGGDGGNSSSFNIDASRSSAVYGKSDTVQPSSLVVNFLIKY